MQCYPGIAEFQRYVADYIENNGCHGRNGYNDSVSFMPRTALNEFWNTERIENVLRSPPERIQAISQTIRSRYVVVFSILVFMSQPEHIPIFIQEAIEDSQLPLAGTPYVFSETPESGIFDEFLKHQWKFCPLELDNGYKLSKRRVSPYHVVPILDKTRINSRVAADDDDVTIYKVTLHPSCFHQTVVVFKVFSGDDPDTERMYDNEVDMYSQLVRERAFNHIIQYYGSFETAGLRTIVLEYANGGSLKSFFLNHPPPHSQGNSEQFWNSLMGLLRGLENIHNLNETKRYSKGAWVLRGTHQDIKPQNILLCNTSFENMYNITFKFVDMGTGNIRKMKNQGLDRDALDQAGNGMYSAPEACQGDGEAKGIRGNSDVWSFGGIASEALVWCIWGEYGRSQY
ncbi:protein kinase domain-containing protein [Colletotrichum kahawae]|uniref:Protein kinase domain-containing protein n=1 Tax=Colletotrichum kahawae TaxID=34407 RepID=A0AAD9XZ07_COLKA|nr:protein kinase domain-containing protein [Colletotrichum kahawae]